MKTLITNVNLTDADGDRPGRVLIEDGVIKRVYKPKSNLRVKVDKTIDGGGLTLMPGFIDTHAHLRDPGYTYKEDIHSGMHAAVKGGFTTVTAMGNTKPVMDNAAMLKANNDKAEALGICRLLQVCALTKGFGSEECVDFERIAPYTKVISNDGYNVDDPKFVAEGLKATQNYDLILETHNEPETEMVERDINILRETGGRLHICHISRQATLEAIKAAKAEGLDITCEVTPHHLYASGREYKVHPPFRTPMDVRALIEGARDGFIDTCGTDHAPHSEEDKKKGAPGINNFETAFAMYHTVFERSGIPLSRLSEMMSAAPAKMLGLPGGRIKAGMPADLVLVDTQAEWMVEPAKFVSKSHNTPFGREWLKGRVEKTWKDGKLVYDAQEEIHD